MVTAREGEIKQIGLMTEEFLAQLQGLCSSPKYSFSHRDEVLAVAGGLCGAAADLSTRLTCAHGALRGRGCFLDLFLHAGESQHSGKSHRRFPTSTARRSGTGFLPREHYANSSVKRIGIALPFASAVLADSTGAVAVCLGGRGLVWGREKLPPALCCDHRRDTCLQIAGWVGWSVVKQHRCRVGAYA